MVEGAPQKKLSLTLARQSHATCQPEFFIIFITIDHLDGGLFKFYS